MEKKMNNPTLTKKPTTKDILLTPVALLLVSLITVSIFGGKDLSKLGTIVFILFNTLPLGLLRAKINIYLKIYLLSFFAIILFLSFKNLFQ